MKSQARTWEDYGHIWQQDYEHFKQNHNCPNCEYSVMRWRFNQPRPASHKFPHWKGTCSKCNHQIIVPTKTVNTLSRV